MLSKEKRMQVFMQRRAGGPSPALCWCSSCATSFWSWSRQDLGLNSSNPSSTRFPELIQPLSAMGHLHACTQGVRTGLQIRANPAGERIPAND